MTRRAASLSESERAAYEATMQGTHFRNVELDFYRRDNGKPVLTVRENYMGGTVEGDLERTPVTFMECDILDESEELDWDDGEFRQFFVQVMDSRFVPELDDWVEEVAFTGPVWDWEREGAVIRMVAEGPEVNALGSIAKADTWPGGARATTVIRALLSRAGATRSDMAIPNLKRTLPRSVTVGVKRGKGKKGKRGKKKERRGPQRFNVDHSDTYWGEAESIAEAIDRDLFAAASGRFRLAHPSNRPRVRLSPGVLLSPVIPKREESEDGEQVNTWIVTGPDPKGPRKQPQAKVTLPRTHVASAESLAWNGVPRAVVSELHNKQIKTKRQARRMGQRLRDKSLREVSSVEVSALPVIVSWRPYALVAVPTPTGRVVSVVRSWQIPIGLGAEPVVLGSTERVRTRIKRGRKAQRRRRAGRR